MLRLSHRSVVAAAVLAIALAGATLLTAGSSLPPREAGPAAAFPTRGAAVPAAFTRISSPTPLPGYALQVGDAVMVTCPGFLVIDPGPKGLRLRCAREATPTATASTATPSPDVGTATVTPSPVSSATASVTATPSSESSPTATVTSTPSTVPTTTPTPRPTMSATPTHAPGSFALGFRLAGDPGVVTFANAHLRSTDFVHMSVAGMSLLNTITVAERQISIGSPAELAAALSAARSSSIDTVMMNEEIPSAQCAQLAQDEATVSAQLRAVGIRFIFAPTVVDVEKCGDQYPFAALADGMMLQVQSKQNSATFAADVHALNRHVRSQHPGIWLEDQVSVNPPSNRFETAAMVLADIAALEDGSVDAPEAVNLFWSSTDSTRRPVMEVVAGTLRP